MLGTHGIGACALSWLVVTVENIKAKEIFDRVDPSSRDGVALNHRKGKDEVKAEIERDALMVKAMARLAEAHSWNVSDRLNPQG